MDELYDDSAVELDSSHMQKIMESSEWWSIDFVYIFIVDVSLPK
jgi:hypothetical protein